MKHVLLAAALTAVCFPSEIAASKVDAIRQADRQESFRFMPKVKTPNVFGVREDANDGVKVKAASGLVSEKLPEGDVMGFLETPDGEQWSYVGQFTKGEGSHIEHFEFTVYDAGFKPVATIADDTELADGEVRIIDVQLGGLVTRKFFNNDDSPEFMLAFAANTTNYVNHYYTKVYSGGKDEPIASFEGYWCTDVNTSTDSWSENYYIGFMTEQEPAQTEVGGVMNTVDYVVDIYKKAGYGSSCETVHEIRIPSILTTGESWIPVVAVAHDGNAYFAANYLKYSFYEDPYDLNNENLTPDNEFIIDYYQVARYGNDPVTLANRTVIPTVGSASNMNFYYLGAFLFDGDITYGRYTDDGEPSFTITCAHYETSSDEYSYSYYVYPAGSEETPRTEKILTLGEGIDGATVMSDLRGYDPQVMFIRNNNGDYTFDFVNLITGNVEATLPYAIADGVTLNAGVDRVAGENGPLYVASQYTAESDVEGNAIQVVAYVTPDGQLHHTDRLNLGQNVAYGSVFNSAYALDPYIFNTDTDREYMVLVKRFLSQDGSATREELMVVSPSKGTLLTLLPDDELGKISFVQLEDKTESGQDLYVVYETAERRYNTVRYELPLEKFAGGDGTTGNPWQIATLGDLRQVKFNLSANYILVSDLDARGVEMEHVAGKFAGKFDGDGHSIVGPELYGHGIFESLSGENAEVRDLNILAPKMVMTDYSEAGVLVDNVVSGKITNVRIYDAVAEGETPEVNATFGGVTGSAALSAQITGSAVIGADINLPESTVGGIAGKIATSTTIKACSFKGDITGGTSVGGIVGDTNTAGDCIEDCHVNAAISGKNTIGGIAGTSARGTMQRCHVEGSIEATEAPMWGGGASTGGLIGKLATDWNEESTTPVIKGNFINLSSLTAFAPVGEPNYDGEFDTFHRVVGATCANEEPRPIFDEDWNLIGYGDAMVEVILADNYVAGSLARGNEEIADDATTTEGKSVTDDELSKEFFEGLGFVFGNENSAPWSEMSPKAPRLYFETGMIVFDKDAYKMIVADEADLVISLYGEPVDDDTLGSFTVDIADESVIEFVDLSVVDGNIVLKVKALKEGTTAVTANYNGCIATTNVTVEYCDGIDAVNADSAPSIEVNGSVVTAEGCMLEVYSTSGVKVLGGNGSCDLGHLAGGVYIVSATDAAGHRTVLKVMR